MYRVEHMFVTLCLPRWQVNSACGMNRSLTCTTIYSLSQLIFCFHLIIKDGKFPYMAVFHVSISACQSLATVFLLYLIWNTIAS